MCAVLSAWMYLLLVHHPVWNSEPQQLVPPNNLEHVPNFPAGLAGSAPCKEEGTWPQECMSAAG